MNDRSNNTNDASNVLNKINGNKENVTEDPLVKCNIDWIKEGEKYMQKREMNLKQTTINDKCSHPEEKDNIPKKLANNGKDLWDIGVGVAIVSTISLYLTTFASIM